MATIGRKYIISKGIGTVIWSWTDYEEQLHTNKSNNIIYFTDSTVNILSTNALYESMKDNERTWVLTKIKYSIFTWDCGRYKTTIAHSEICLPELEIQAGFSKFDGFYKRLRSI